MKTITDPQKIKEVLTRGVEEIIDKENLRKNLESGKQLRVKLGIDPTSPDIHIGRTIPLLKLRDFQELGHKVVFIIGDFTGVIGDTSDKDSERPMLSEKQIGQNMKNYIGQAGKIIDIKKCEINYNSKWLEGLGYREVGKQANVFSLNEFSSRENIRKRLNAGKRVSLRELLYPLMQGYDSVKVKADVELGGTDQKFNLLAGRELQRFYGQSPQDIVMNPLIEGTDGRKMSSSWGNVINLLDRANEMYGKLMSLKDELIIKYFLLATRENLSVIEKYQKEIKDGANPMDYKMKLAFKIVEMYHGGKSAQAAEREFSRVFKEKEAPSEIEEVEVMENSLNILDLLVKMKLVPSKAEAKRLIVQGGVKVGGEVQKDWGENVVIKKGLVVQVGKRKFAKIA